MPVTHTVNHYGRVTVWGQVVDITLRQLDDGTCLFFDLSTGLCRNYASRPLVCRTYFCCPSSRRAKLLREAIVNQGQDELVRLLLLQAGGPAGLRLDEADSPDVRLRDWPANAFSGKGSYGEVLLREVCSARLWQQLVKPPRHTHSTRPRKPTREHNEERL